MTPIQPTEEQRYVEAELRGYAKAAGATDITDVTVILQRTLKPEFDDDGLMTNAETAIADLKTRKPHLFAQPSDGAVSVAGPQRQIAQRSALQPQKTKSVANMSHSEYQEARRELVAKPWLDGQRAREQRLIDTMQGTAPVAAPKAAMTMTRSDYEQGKAELLGQQWRDRRDAVLKAEQAALTSVPARR